MELSGDEIEVLSEALDDEYKAHATYAQVMKDFAEVRPFSNIREAESRHIDALLMLYRKIENGERYNRLLPKTRRPDLLAVLENLQAASQQRHLPASQRCAEGKRGVCGDD